MPDDNTGQSSADGQQQQQGAEGQQQQQGAQGTGQQGSQSQQGQGTSGTGQGTSGATKFEYPEDRSRWIPPHRFGEVSTRARTLEAQIAERDRQIAALTNSRAPEPNEQEADGIRQKLFELVPQLEKFASLSDEQLARLLQTPDLAEAAQRAEEERWGGHASQQLDVLSELVAGHIGVEQLTQDQRDDLTEAFKRYVLSTVQREIDTTGASPTGARYQKGDRALLTEFAERYKKNWFEPARRKVTAGEVDRSRRVPDSKGRNTPNMGQKRPTLKTIDDYVNFGAELAQERGLTFERE
jgi:hypothetical protein